MKKLYIIIKRIITFTILKIEEYFEDITSMCNLIFLIK